MKTFALNRVFTTLAALGAALAMASYATSAAPQTSEFPSKAVTIVVPFPAGGVSDQLARGIGQKMAESMKVPVVVDNRPGAGAQIAANLLKQAPADGYTVLIGDIGAFALNTSLYPKLSYDPLKDFTPLARVALAPSLLVVPANSPFNTVDELVQAAKARPGMLTMASQSSGSGGHLFAEMLRSQAGATFNHIPYRGSAPALMDMVSSRVDAFFDPLITSGPFVKEGKLKALAIGAAQRSPVFPQVSTLGELGYERVSLVAWFGMAVKAGTPAPVVKRLSDEVIKALNNPELAKRFTDQGLDVSPQASPVFRTFMESEISRWGKVIKDAGIVLE
jgi:tripartite-type tricarboxylate transporter receptor subunit TctC